MSARAFETIRHVVLPIWYSVAFGGLFMAYRLMEGSRDLAIALWVGVVALGPLVLLGLEALGLFLSSRTLGAEERLFLSRQAATIKAYSRSSRLWFLMQAGFCWFFCGIATITLFHGAGARLAESFAIPQILSSLGPVTRLALAFLGLDCWSYCRHRLEHAGNEQGLLWRLVHRWHHTPTEVNLWTGSVVHPIESALVFAVPSLLLGMLGLARWEMFFLFTLFVLIAAPQHMNSGWTSGVFGALIHGPEAHVRHHSLAYADRSSNFADCLTLWDRLFGTFVKAERSVFRGPFGLPARPVESTRRTSRQESRAKRTAKP